MLKKISLVLTLMSGLAALSFGASTKIVALDCFHNTETPAHYTWDQTGLGGFSNFGGIILSLGADTTRITKAFDSADLAPFSVLIIVNPCTPANPGVINPNYIADSEAAAVDKWVQRGGKLMMFANNIGNCEFTHYNVLAGKFGIMFNQNTQTGGSTFGPVPTNEVFSNCSTFYIVNMCNLSITSPAQSIFTFQDSVLMAVGTKGSGVFFAVGDPWVYNEHIAAQDNIKGITKVVTWLLGNTTPVLRSMAGAQREAQKSLQNGYRLVLPNGRLVSSGAVYPPGSSFAPKAHGVVYIEGTSGGGQEHVSLRP